MFWRAFKHELTRSTAMYAVWAAISTVLAIFARIKLFSLTDMPLFYLMFFGSVGIMLYRYYCSMHGSEAAYLFTLDLSAKQQMMIRYISMLFWSVVTAWAIGFALMVQGEDMSQLLQSQSLSMTLLLASEITFSVFTLVILHSAALTLANIRPFSGRHILYFILFAAIGLGGISLLSRTTAKIIPFYLVATNSGKILISETSNTASSISFSFNTLMWDAIFSVACIVSIPAIIRKKLIIAG